MEEKEIKLPDNYENTKENKLKACEYLIEDEISAQRGYDKALAFFEEQEVKDIFQFINSEEQKHIELINYIIDKYCK